MCIITEAQGSELPCCLIYRTEYRYRHFKFLMLSNTVSCLLERSCTAQGTQCSFHARDIAGQGSGGQPPIPGIRQLQGPCWGQVVMPAWVKVVAVHRQSWGCMWGCNWNKGQWDSLHLNTAPRGRRARPLRGLSFLQGYQPLLLPSQPWAATLPGGRGMCAVHLQCWPAASEVGIAYLSIKRWNEIIT